MKAKCLYPASFDPITIGHLDVIERSRILLSQNEKLIVMVATNKDKNHQFSIKKRLKMVKKATENMNNVEVVLFENTISDYLNENEIKILIRGIRNIDDMHYEQKLEAFTRATTNTETIYFNCKAKQKDISSSHVRLLMKMGYTKEVKNLVPKKIFKFLK